MKVPHVRDFPLVTCLDFLNRLDEGEKIEVDEEVDNKKKLDQKKKDLQKQMRDLEKFTCMQQDTQSRLKGTWQRELQDIEQKRNDLLREHLQMQKKISKVAELHDKKRQYQKNVGKWAREVERSRNEIEEKDAQLQELGRKIQKKHLWQKRSSMKRSETCKRERKDEAVVHLSPTGAASIQPWWSSSRWEQHRHGSRSKLFKRSSAKH